MLGKVEVEVELLQASELLDLHLGKSMPPASCLVGGEAGGSLWGRGPLLADLLGVQLSELLPGDPSGSLAVGPTLDWFAAGHFELFVGA